MGKADMGVQTLLITASRSESGNYSMIPSPIPRTYAMVAHKRHLDFDVATSSWRMLFHTFTPTSWAGIGVMLLVIFTALLLSQKLRAIRYRRTFRWRNIWFDVFMGVLSNDWRKWKIPIFPAFVVWLKHPCCSGAYNRLQTKLGFFHNADYHLGRVFPDGRYFIQCNLAVKVSHISSGKTPFRDIGGAVVDQLQNLRDLCSQRVFQGETGLQRIQLLQNVLCTYRRKPKKRSSRN
ncbi:hypothetical protein RvY_16460-3 [Ramazzottius varieornatus]|uniref:Uncharacterized protein n=1 Tax=Ramazzottius varieornatus TaxID=947166 RepID=A0A1D1W636_RAMVA|nr:hypothetical protein RvY_16460-3 [Ramazzottius varieornatus]